MRKTFLSLITGVLVAGCAATPPVVLNTPFNASDFAWASAEGKNTITGSALMRTRGGDIRTCAGFRVTLMPATAYSREVVSHAYTKASGFSVTPDPGFATFARQTVCDAQGKFSFANLPDGPWILMTKVTWEVPKLAGKYSYMSNQGGNLTQEVTVSGGQTRDVVLTS